MLVLTPAYGRDYKSAKAVKADWDKDMDFIIANVMHPYSGKPCNKSDIEQTSERTVQIRYNQMRSQTVIKL